jgi:hypothetical protein
METMIRAREASGEQARPLQRMIPESVIWLIAFAASQNRKSRQNVETSRNGSFRRRHYGFSL